MKWSVNIAMPQNQITKSYEAALQAEFQGIVDAVESGVCGLDAQGNATFCNDALLRMTGYRAEEIVGQNAHRLLHHSHQDGSSYPAEECNFRKAIVARQAVHITNEFLWRKDKSCFPAEYWVRPLARSSGGTFHVVTVKDTSDAYHAMEAARQSQERFRRIPGQRAGCGLDLRPARARDLHQP